MKKDKYDKQVNKILKTYNSVLVKCENIPILPDKNIIKVSDIDSMINTQIETRKPILYFEEQLSTSFLILDSNEVYVFMLKKFPNIENKVDKIINSMEYSKYSFFNEINPNEEKLLENAKDQSEKIQEIDARPIYVYDLNPETQKMFGTSLKPYRKRTLFDKLFTDNIRKIKYKILMGDIMS